MKYFIYVFLLLLFQFLLGYLESEYVYYFTAFQIVVFIVVALYLKFNINLNKYFVLFSYSILLLLLSFLIDFSLIIYFFIFVTPITIFLSYRFHNEEKSVVKGIIFVFVILYSILSISMIHENIFYFNNYKKEFRKEINITIYDIDNKPIKLDKQKVYVLDVWTTTCGVCIEKFPEFSELCEKYSTNSNLEFCSLNVRLNNSESDRALKYVVNKNYCFDNLFINSKEDAKRIDVQGYPTILIVKNNEIIYNGYPGLNKFIFFNNLDQLIKDNL